MVRYDQYADAELAVLLKRGDRLAFAEIYERFKGPLYVHAFRKSGSEEEADDIVHDLFATLWENRETLELTGHLSGYLYTATRNRVFKMIARKDLAFNYLVSIKESIEAGHCVTDHLARENQLAAIIEKEISNLPPKMQEVFLLSRKAGLSHKQIAEKLEISEETVKKHVHHALQTLRVKLGIFVYLYMIFHI